MELNKLQRLTCLAITGAMGTTPTAAMEVLLGLSPLLVIIEAEAQAVIYRLTRNHQ
jgi:hypothetical protein